MKNFYLVLFIFVCASISAQNLAKKSILTNTYHLRYTFGDTISSGTCFRVLYQNRPFIVTAKHIFPRRILNDTTIKIELLYKEEWIELNAKFYCTFDTCVDIAVLDIGNILKPRIDPPKMHTAGLSLDSFNLNTNQVIDSSKMNTVFIGDRLAFFGFPEVGTTKLGSFKGLPLIKYGYYSGVVIDSLCKRDVYQHIIDGQNTFGFSGGPVVAMSSNNEILITGVVHGFRPEKRNFKGKNLNIKNIVIPGIIPEVQVAENSGVMIAHDISFAVEIIKNNFRN